MKWIVYIVASFAALWLTEALILVAVVSLGIQEFFDGVASLLPEGVFAALIVGIAVFSLSGWLTDRLGPSPKAIVVLAVVYAAYQALTLIPMIENGESSMIFVSVGSVIGLVVQSVLKSQQVTERD